MEARCVDLMRVVKDVCEVFEVLQARVENENKDEEWMYRLERQGNVSGGLCNDPVSRAVKMCRDEQFLEALTVLQEECPIAQHSKMTQRLQRKVHKSAEGRFKFADFVACEEE